MKYFEQLTVEDLKLAFLKYCRETYGQHTGAKTIETHWNRFYNNFKDKCSVVDRV